MKEKGIKLLIIFVLIASVLMPFSVSADTISSSDIQGVERVLVNSTYLDQTVTNAGNTYKYYSFDYEVTVLLKDYYLGWIQGTFQTSYKTFDNADWSVMNASCTTASKSYYVNDNKFSSSFSFTAWVLVNQQGNVDPAGSYSTSFTLSNSNVTAYQDLNSIETVIDILQDISQYVSVDVLGELQTIVSNTNLSNTYLEYISKLRQWNFPIESLNFIYYQMMNNRTIVDIKQFNNYTFPVFQKFDGVLVSAWMASSYTYKLVLCTLGITITNLNDFSRYFPLTNGTASNFEVLSYISNYSIFTVDISPSSQGTVTVNWSGGNFNIIPIYFANQDNHHISTDFALNFGLRNEVLDNLNVIAQGTQQSNSAASGLESSNSTMASDMNSMATIENGYSQDFNSQLQNIDFTNPIQQNQGILPAANFVISIFNGLINNNPFTVLIIIVCILLIGKKVIGK